MDPQGPGPALRNANPMLRAAMADIFKCFESGIQPSERQMAAFMNNASPGQMAELYRHDPSQPSASSARIVYNSSNHSSNLIQPASSPKVVRLRSDSCSVCRRAPATGSKLRY